LCGGQARAGPSGEFFSSAFLPLFRPSASAPALRFSITLPPFVRCQLLRYSLAGRAGRSTGRPHHPAARAVLPVPLAVIARLVRPALLFRVTGTNHERDRTMTRNATERHDIYTRLTSKIVSALENGVRPWRQPWETGDAGARVMRPLRHNGLPYAGINTIMLWLSGMENGYLSPHWMTFRQAAELKAHVRKGERGSPVVYASKITRTERNEAGEDVERDIPFLKTYTVFNAGQIDKLPEHYYAKPAPRLQTVQRIQEAEAFFAATQADIRHGGNRAFYSPQHDFIQMPPIESFRDAEAYYSTLGHETVHWTQHPSRLDRDTGKKKWGDEGYAMEELVAELGAAYTCADLDLVPTVLPEGAGQDS
jgi:antirestriction protein ArdC